MRYSLLIKSSTSDRQMGLYYDDGMITRPGGVSLFSNQENVDFDFSLVIVWKIGSCVTVCRCKVALGWENILNESVKVVFLFG